MFISPSDQLFPNGVPIDFTHGVKVTRAFLQFDPVITASAATTFTLQNQATTPTSSGTVTVASGASFGQSTTLGVTVPAGGRLYVKSPAALNNLQNLFAIRIEWTII